MIHGSRESGPAEGTDREEQRIAWQERRDHQACFRENDDKDDYIHPGAVRFGQREQLLVDLQDENL